MAGVATKKINSDYNFQLQYPAVFQNVYARSDMPLEYLPANFGNTPQLESSSDIQSQYHAQKKLDADRSAMNGVHNRKVAKYKLRHSHANYFGMPQPVLGQRIYANPSNGNQSDIYSNRPNTGLRGGVLYTNKGQQYGRQRLHDRIGQLNAISEAKQNFQTPGAAQTEDFESPYSASISGSKSTIEVVQALQGLLSSVYSRDYSGFAFKDLSKLTKMVFRFAVSANEKEMIEVKDLLDYVDRDIETYISEVRRGYNMPNWYGPDFSKEEGYREGIQELVNKLQKYMNGMIKGANLSLKDRKALSANLVKSLGFLSLEKTLKGVLPEGVELREDYENRMNNLPIVPPGPRPPGPQPPSSSDEEDEEPSESDEPSEPPSSSDDESTPSNSPPPSPSGPRPPGPRPPGPGRPRRPIEPDESEPDEPDERKYPPRPPQDGKYSDEENQPFDDNLPEEAHYYYSDPEAVDLEEVEDDPYFRYPTGSSWFNDLSTAASSLWDNYSTAKSDNYSTAKSDNYSTAKSWNPPIVPARPQPEERSWFDSGKYKLDDPLNLSFLGSKSNEEKMIQDRVNKDADFFDRFNVDDFLDFIQGNNGRYSDKGFESYLRKNDKLNGSGKKKLVIPSKKLVVPVPRRNKAKLDVPVRDKMGAQNGAYLGEKMPGEEPYVEQNTFRNMNSAEMPVELPKQEAPTFDSQSLEEKLNDFDPNQKFGSGRRRAKKGGKSFFNVDLMNPLDPKSPSKDIVRRGRPKKQVAPAVVKRGRGRPRKVPLVALQSLEKKMGLKPKKMSVKEIKKKLKEYKVKGVTGKKKPQLLKILNEHEEKLK